MTFEQVERGVRAKSPALATELETAFASLRTRAAGGATPAELDGPAAAAQRRSRERRAGAGRPDSPVNLFVQSFIILLREGLEAILIVGALMTFLSKMGAGHRKRDIHIGVGAAVGASLLTAVALETIFVLSPAHREALEGGTMVLATAVLFYVSYWLLSKMEVVKWNHFVKSKVQDALDSGSALALASAAFLAVYREGFETVLFYKALFVAGAGGTMPVLAGIVAGSVVLVGVYVAINRFGVRLPLKPFFAITSAFLYYMAFVFAGKGIAELQEGDLIGTTILSWAPRVPALGIYPTAESLGAQAVLVVLAIVALVWTFVVEPRRVRGVTPVMVPEPGRASRGRWPRPGAGAGGGRDGRRPWWSCSARSSAWRPTWPRCGPRSSACGGTCAPTPRPRCSAGLHADADSRRPISATSSVPRSAWPSRSFGTGAARLLRGSGRDRPRVRGQCAGAPGARDRPAAGGYWWWTAAARSARPWWAATWRRWRTENGWTGLLVHGCVRDARSSGHVAVGVKALHAVPRKSGKSGAGEQGVPVTFAGVTFTRGCHLYADRDGVVVADRD